MDRFLSVVVNSLIRHATYRGARRLPWFGVVGLALVGALVLVVLR